MSRLVVLLKWDRLLSQSSCICNTREETLGREHVARLEMAWETEKRRLALAKLKAYFLDKVR